MVASGRVRQECAQRTTVAASGVRQQASTRSLSSRNVACRSTQYHSCLSCRTSRTSSGSGTNVLLCRRVDVRLGSPSYPSP